MGTPLSAPEIAFRDRIAGWLSKYPWTWEWTVTFDRMERRLAQQKTTSAKYVPGHGWSGGGALKEWGKDGWWKGEDSNVRPKGTTQNSAKKIFERYMKKVLPEFSWFYVTEPNPGRAGNHLHSLLIPPKGMGVDVATHGSAWWNDYGWNKLQPIRSRDDITRYCTKHVCFYLTKGAGWYNIEINDTEIFHAANTR